MKIPNLSGKDYKSVLNTIKGIVKSVKESDKKSIDEGELLKYVVEVYNKENILSEVREIYSKYYLFNYEIVKNLSLDSIKHIIRGPFPLVEGALADAELNRWEIEKEKEEKDLEIIENHLAGAENKEYKYGYIVYEDVIGVKRFVELMFTKNAIVKNKIDKILNSSNNNRKRKILRIRLSNKQEKLFE